MVGVAVLAATLWWAAPLLVLGRYSPPFLSFIESAAVTTGTATVVETLRGTADWVAYLGDTGSRMGFALLTQPVPIAMSVIVVVLSLAGVSMRRTPERVWLVLMLVTGVALVAAAHVGSIEGFWANGLRDALDGALAPFRNVHKFDILIRLSLSLGLTAALGSLAHGRSAVETRFLRPVVAAAGAFAVLGASSMFIGLAGAPVGAYDGVPAYWSQAAGWLAAHNTSGRTLLLPASRFAQYDWGSTGDEPIQALASTPWDVRSAVPLSDAGHIRWLDGIEQEVAAGRGGADLAARLRLGGISQVLVRNDLSYGPAQATRPILVRAALLKTPGVDRVASFGPLVGGNAPGATTVGDARLNVALPAIEIYSVATSGVADVALVPSENVARLEGSAESVTDVAEIGATTAITAPGDVVTARGPRVLTDTPRYREANFGTGPLGVSQTLAVDDPLRIFKSVRDYGATGSPTSDAVAQILGVSSIRASSSASDADAFPLPETGEMPYAAFDNDPDTLWRPNPVRPVAGSWIEVDFGRSVDLTGGLVLLDSHSAVTSLSVVTDRGPTTVPVVNDVAVLPGVRATRLRLGFDRLTGSPQDQRRAGIRGVTIPGVLIQRTVVLPTPGWSSAPDLVVLAGDQGPGSCVVVGTRPLCAPTLGRVGEDAAGLDRTITSGTAFTGTLALDAVPRPSAALERAVVDALDLPLNATASSRAVPDLGGAPFAAIDGSAETAWVAAPDDTDPTLTLSWPGRRRIDSITVYLDDYVAATRPATVRITSAAGSRSVTLDALGRASFAPLLTDRVVLHLAAPVLTRSVDPYSLATTSLNVGVSEVRLGGAPAEGVHSSPISRPVDIPCGEGPTLTVGNRTVRTRVSTTTRALIDREVVHPSVCGTSALDIGAGQTRVRVAREIDRRFALTGVVVRRLRTSPGPGTSGTPAVEVLRWDATHRTVAVPARGGDDLLVVRANANPGWSATLNGSELAPVTVAGWQQGFVVPAGVAGEVHLVFGPDRPYRLGLLAGAFAALALVGLAVLPSSRAARAAPVRPGGRVTRLVVVGVALAALGATAGLVGLVAFVITSALGAVEWNHGRRTVTSWPWFVPTVASGAYAGAGLVLTIWHYTSSGGYLAASWPVQVMSVFALAAVITSLIRWVPGDEAGGATVSVRDGGGAPSR